MGIAFSGKHNEPVKTIENTSKLTENGVTSKTNDAQPSQAGPASQSATGTEAERSTSHTQSETSDGKPKTKPATERIANTLKKLRKRISVIQVNPKDVTETMNDPVLMGDLSVTVPNTAKIVRIFTSSTFTDTKQERNFLMKNAYPKLQKHCRKKGFEFQVVDMRWGVRDVATDDNTTTELCLKEIKLCQQLSTGPNFITLLSQKYGYRPIPRTVRADEFALIERTVTGDEDNKLLTTWYVKDENADPAEYVLCSRSKIIPGYDHNDEKMKNKADQIIKSLSKILVKAAEVALSSEDAIKYAVSVTETEIYKGLLDVKDPGKTCLWYNRNIEDIDDQIEKSRSIETEKERTSALKLLSKYKECEDAGWEEANAMLTKLKDEKIKKCLPSDNIRPWSIKWYDGEGVFKKDEVHQEYLKNMADDFVGRMRKMIDAGIQERNDKGGSHPVYKECLQHIKFAQNKCEHFVGMDKTLQKIKDYVLSKRNDVLIIHGNSGRGKTSLLAKTAQLLCQWIDAKPAVILRFIGTTPESSNISTLLINIITQIRVLYRIEEDFPETLNDITKEAEDILDNANPNMPLVIILDSLDQLDTAYNAKSLFWLPAKLPPYVKIIVSTIEDVAQRDNKKEECFENLKVMFSGKNNFIPVPDIENEDVEHIIDKWLKARNRCLTDTQRKIVMNAFVHCPVPLFLKLSVDEACRWQSHWPISDTILQKTVQASIENLFKRLEKSHGEKLVQRALGYLTASRNGLSEMELEDILSCDDDVLRDVYQYSVPPIIRLPPLLLVRLRNDLQGYIVERGADGVNVMYWYHRQFLETAQNKYLPNDTTERSLHQGLAEFFSGKWSKEKKPYYNQKKKKTKEKNRQVMVQKVKNGDVYNYRMLNNLPFHLTKAKLKDLLKTKCLTNFEFLQTKLLATSIRYILDDFSLAVSVLKKDEDIEDLQTIRSALELSTDALMYDPNQLAPQLLDRLSEEKSLESFCKQCEKSPKPYLVPDHELQMKPGGQLVSCMTGHHGPIVSLDVNYDGSKAVTCADDDEDSVKTWDICEGQLLKSFNGLGRNPSLVRFVMSDSYVLVTYDGCFKALTESGETVYTIEYNVGVDVVTERDKSKLCVFTKTEATLYNLSNGDEITTLEYPREDYVFCEETRSCVAASPNYVILTRDNKQDVTQFSVATHEFSEWTNIFPSSSGLTVDAIVVTPDENTIILSNAFDNDLHVFNRKNMEKITSIKGDRSDFAANYKHFPDRTMLYFANCTDIVKWDMHTQKRQTILTHPREITDCLSVSSHRIMTASEDAVLRVWNLEESEQTSKFKAPILGFKIRHFVPLPNPEYCVVLSEELRSVTRSELAVYHIPSKQVVRKSTINSMPGVMKPIGEEEVIFVTDTRRLKVVNVNSMKVIKTFEGGLSYFTNDIEILSKKNEIVTQTKGRMKFKIYDMKTGKTKAVLRRPPNVDQKACFKSLFHVNSTGTRLAGLLRDGPWLIFNLDTHECVLVPFLETLRSEHAAISNDGSRFLFSSTADLRSPGQRKYKIKTFVLWDTETNEKISDCIDLDQQRGYFDRENRRGIDVALDSIYLLDDERIITTHDDFVMRVWDVKTGKLMNRLHGHKSSTRVFKIDASPYFGSFEEQNIIRMWHKSTLECIASYSLDINVVSNKFCSDGKTFVSSTKSPNARLIHWCLQDTSDKVNSENHHPKSFGGEPDLDLKLDLSSEEGVLDHTDPDTDESDNESDGSDDDDDFADYNGLIM